MAINDHAPSFSETDIQNDAKRQQLKDGTYRFRVTSAEPKISAKSGNMFLSLKAAPVDLDGNVFSPTTLLAVTLPFKTPPEALTEAGLPADVQVKGPPNTLYLCQQYAQARQNAATHVEIDTLPAIKKVNGKWALVDSHGVPTGEALGSRDERDEAAKEISRQVRTFLVDAWKNPSMLVGDEFYGTVAQEEGREYPSVNVAKSQDPETYGDLVTSAAEAVAHAAA